LLCFLKKVKNALITRQTSDKVFTESNATNRHQALVRSQENILNQARNQLGAPGWAKSFLRGAQILNYFQYFQSMSNTFYRVGERNFKRALPSFVPGLLEA